MDGERFIKTIYVEYKVYTSSGRSTTTTTLIPQKPFCYALVILVYVIKFHQFSQTEYVST